MNVTIRPLQEQDAYTSVKWRNDPEVFKYTGNTYKNEITLETELNWIRKVMANENEYRCAIMADDVYVGNIYLTDITEESAHYHIFIGNKDYWGKGVAKKASEQIINYAFFVLKLQFICLRVKKQNEVALGLYQKLGFVKKRVDNDWNEMELINRYSNIIRMLEEYRYKPVGISVFDHYKKWLSQFSVQYHDAITDTLNHVLLTNYYSEERYNKLILNFISKIDERKWSSTYILCPKTNGKSQSEIVEKMKEILSARGIQTCSSLQDCERYFYIDDFSFTGDRLEEDLRRCVRENVLDTNKKVYAYFFVVHSPYINQVKKNVQTNLNVDIEICYDRMIASGHNNCNVDEIFWTSLNSYNSNPYLQKLSERNGIYRSNFRDGSSIGNNLFADNNKRTLCEEALFIKGCECYTSIGTWRPMGKKGQSVASYLGFGATIFSYRNAANVLPLAFWWGYYENNSLNNYPLIRRKTYEDNDATE